MPVSSPSPTRRDLLEQLLLEREQPLRAAVEPPPGLGRLDAAAGAVEELRAEPLLERADLEADGRLRDAEPLRRLREALPLDDGAERSELTRVHKHSIMHWTTLRVSFVGRGFASTGRARRSARSRDAFDLELRSWTSRFALLFGSSRCRSRLAIAARSS